MNTAVTSLSMPSSAAAAAGSSGARLRQAFRHAGTAVWSALQAVGQARAQNQLAALARQYEALQPALARELRAASRQGPMA